MKITIDIPSWEGWRHDRVRRAALLVEEQARRVGKNPVFDFEKKILELIATELHTAAANARLNREL
jgi:hypothetical protein